MYCRNCGKEIGNDSSACIHCGASVTQTPTRKESNTLAIVGFVLSFFITIAGLICSIIGYRNAHNNDVDGRGLALAGIIISAMKLAGEVLLIIIYIGLIIALITNPPAGGLSTAITMVSSII